MDAGDREARGDTAPPRGEQRRPAARGSSGAAARGQDLRLDLARGAVPTRVPGPLLQVSNPFLWFLQHQLYTLPYEPTVDDELIDAWRTAIAWSTRRLGEAARRGRRIRRYSRPVVLLQDYHLYLAAASIREARPDALLLHFNHIPWPAVETLLVLPQGCGARSARVCWRTTSWACRPTATRRTSCSRSTPSCATRGSIRTAGTSAGAVGRSGCAPTRSPSIPTALTEFAPGPAVAAQRAELLARLERAGAATLIVRVDRLEPSKNALRGFLAFEALLQRRPELRRRCGSWPSSRSAANASPSTPLRGRGARGGRPRQRHDRSRRAADLAARRQRLGAGHRGPLSGRRRARQPHRRRHEPGRQGGGRSSASPCSSCPRRPAPPSSSRPTA